MITQTRLKELFDYNLNTGVVTRLSSPARCVKVGDVVGSRTSKGYLDVGIDGVSYKLHRIIWLYIHGEFPTDQIDHVNGDRSDNRLSNLRCVTNKGNSMNRALSTRNKSGVLGVHRNNRLNKWQAKIVVDGERKHLGIFSDFFEACCARKSAENKYGYHSNHGRMA